MRYELRTTFTIDNGLPTVPGDIGTGDRVLRWLNEYLPTLATRGSARRPPMEW